MALDSFANLKSALTSWCNDRSDVATNADDFIRLSEGHFNLELRCRQMVAQTSLTPSSGAVTLPTDFVGVRRVVEKTSPRRVLSYISPEAADEQFDANVTGFANCYTIIGSSLKTFPQATSDIELTYYQEIPALSDSNTSNWLLAKYPNLYLEAGMREFYRWAKDDNELAKSNTLVTAYIEMLNMAGNVETYGQAGRTNIGPTP
jgi:hypothetical protein